MPAVSHVLVAGAGLAGTAAAIGLADAGVAVDLIDIKPEITAVGSGITMLGNGLRELRRLGVWDAVLAAGYPYDSVGLRAPDPAGTLLVEMLDARTGGPDLPASLGLSRPALAGIMGDRAVAAGAKLRLGTSVSSLSQDDGGVDVTFSDGSAGRYDLVVGADGIRSATRPMIGIADEPRPTGMGIFRAFALRPASVTRTELYYGGPAYIAGYRAGGADRRRRARLPADPGTGRRTGPGGRDRANRAAAVEPRTRRRAVDGVHRPAVRAGEDRRRGILPARPVAATTSRATCPA